MKSRERIVLLSLISAIMAGPTYPEARGQDTDSPTDNKLKGERAITGRFAGCDFILIYPVHEAGVGELRIDPEFTFLAYIGPNYEHISHRSFSLCELQDHADEIGFRPDVPTHSENRQTLFFKLIENVAGAFRRITNQNVRRMAREEKSPEQCANHRRELADVLQRIPRRQTPCERESRPLISHRFELQPTRETSLDTLTPEQRSRVESRLASGVE